MITFNQKTIDRFYSKIEKTNTCHFWLGAKQKQGYGMFSANGKTISAQRFSYIIEHGSIPENMVVHSTCENNDCVNPNHLKLQSKSLNTSQYNAVRVSKEMIEKESVKYLFRLKTLRPDLQQEIDALLMKLSGKKIIDVIPEDFGFSADDYL